MRQAARSIAATAELSADGAIDRVASPAVEVTVNGVTMHAIIDTGATQLLMPLRMARRAGLVDGAFSPTQRIGAFGAFPVHSGMAREFGGDTARRRKVKKGVKVFCFFFSKKKYFLPDRP